MVLVVVKMLMVVVGVLSCSLLPSLPTTLQSIPSKPASPTLSKHKYGTSNDAGGSEIGWVGMLVVAMVRYWWWWWSNGGGGGHVGSCNGASYDQKQYN